MNNSIHRISLDIHDTASQASINAKKGDTARSIYITLQENGKPYRIAEGCYAVLSGVKPDGNFLFNDCTIKDNIIAYDFTEQTVPAVGQVNCEVILYDANNNRITSPHFVIIVNDVVYNDEEVVSSDEATALITATADAKAITAEVEQKLANGEFVGEKGDKGEKGEPGKDAVTDQTYNPESENAQSGKAVAEALANVGGGGTWEKIADITITKELNGIDATTEEFPQIAKCKEFITRLIFPKTATALTLGATRFYINDTHFFRVNSTGTLNSGLSEIRCHTIIADRLIHTVGNESVRGHGNVVGNAYILAGNLFTDTPQEIRVFLNDTTKYLPVGTQFVIYGKVEG